MYSGYRIQKKYVDNPNNVGRKASIHLRNTKKEYLKAKN
jgi:hypothetical protein